VGLAGWKSMSLLISTGRTLWGIAAASLVARHVVRLIVQSQALDRALANGGSKLTMHDLRCLTNRGDWRDPIERHQDGLLESTRLATLALAAMLLWFVSSIN
jgi:hypothetical protein